MDRDKWLAERNRVPGIGASSAAALYGLHPYESAFSLFEKMTNPKDPTDEEIEEMTDVQAFGLAVEPALAGWYSRKTGREVIEPEGPGVYRVAGKPHIFASPDRFVPNGVLQLKTGINFDPTVELPPSWAIQEQHEMLVTGTLFASFAIWGTFRKRFYVNDIPANLDFQAIHIEECEKFMLAVQTGSWDRWDGEIEGSKATTEALRRLYPRDSGTTVSLPSDACLWADELAAAKLEISQAEQREAAAKNKLLAAIGESTFAQLPDGRKFSLKLQKRAAHVVKESEFRVLRSVK
jgi:predicted phage-related endonuclease